MIRSSTLAIAVVAAAGIAAAQPTPAAAQTHNFVCQSHNQRRAFCEVDQRAEVRLVRQLSDAACIRGRTWGVERRGVWVARGCRAEFAARFDRRGDGRWDDRDRGRWDDRDRGRWDNRSSRAARVTAERVCARAVRDRVRSARSRLDVRYVGADRAGSRLVRWSTSRSSGTCRIDRRDRLAGFVVN